MKFYKVYKKNLKDPYKLYVSFLQIDKELEIRKLSTFEVAQIHSSYPDILKDDFLKAIILSEIALNEIGIII